MFTKIQLRGISNSPSDRMTEDGGCCESSNVILENNEVVPNVEPQDITKDIGFVAEYGDYSSFKLLYIHKTQSFINYIAYSRQKRMVATLVNGNTIPIVTLDSDINDITSLGNIVIILTDSDTHYIIYDDGKYVYLGTQIPVPDIYFNVKSDSMVYRDKQFTMFNGNLQSPSFWESDDENSRAVKEKVYSVRSEILNAVRSQGWFYGPMFIRYAVKMYDGTYIRQSVPILLGAGFDETYRFWVNGSTVYGNVLNTYKITGILDKFNIGNWQKYIQSIDFFITPMYKYPYDDAKVVSYGPVSKDRSGLIFEESRGFDEIEKEKEKRLTDLSNFHLIASFSTDKFLTFLGKEIPFKDVKDIDKCVMEEYLSTLPTLQDDYKSNHSLTAEKCRVYNNRLLLNGVKQKLYTGYPYFNATRLFAPPESGDWQDPKLEYISAKIRFYIKDAFGISYMINCVNSDGGKDINVYKHTFSDLGEPLYNAQTVYGWVTYPDPNCYKAEYFVSVWDGKGGFKREFSFSISMKPHPHLSCSYGYLGLTKKLINVDNESIATTGNENRFIYISNKIYQSEFENPFVFPPSGIHTIPTNQIIGMAGITKPLSTGQFGQFPLYVFTNDGIWAMTTKSDGTFGGSQPVSMDVAISDKLITSLEQAVVFRSKRGLMLMSGSEIICISDYLRGIPEWIPLEAVEMLNYPSKFAQYMKALSNRVEFSIYLDGADASYDSEGNRLIVFNEKYDYHYVYAFSTNTWHTCVLVMHNHLIRLESSVNSYPECYINAHYIELNLYRTYILNMSTKYLSSETQPSIIVSRAYDLNSPDLRKTIKDLRIRGKFAKGAAQYILLGSNDGLEYKVVKSLRASSWKFIKVILVSHLQKGDSISWLELEYDTKFENKMR